MSIVRRSTRVALAALIAAALLTTGCSDDSTGDSTRDATADSAGGSTTTASSTVTTTTLPQGSALAATIEGPVTGGVTGVPFNSMPEGLAEQYDYSELEYYASGDARTFTAAWSPEGVPQVTDTVDITPYRTRIVVRRPNDPAAFNGTVVVEWLNVSGGLDADPVFSLTHPELLREGYAYVAVSAQKAGIDGGGGLIDIPGFEPPYLKQVDPERYGSLVHPGDDFSYDIFAGIAEAIRRSGTDAAGPVDPLGGLVPQRMIAAGESQAADRMVTFVNAFHPMFREFDGYLIQSRFAGGAQLGPASFPSQPSVLPIRDDIDVPVLQFETESDLFKLGFLPVRRPDTDRVRTWEVAGAAHADNSLLEYGVASGQRSLPGTNFDLAAACGRVNEGPQRYVARAAVHALNRWMVDGTEPPSSPLLEVTDTAVARDELGNALGGIRTAAVDAPIVSLSGEFNAAGGIFCDIFGSTTPLSAEQLAARYSSKDDYVAKVEAATDEAIDAGFIRPADKDEIMATARSVDELD